MSEPVSPFTCEMEPTMETAIQVQQHAVPRLASESAAIIQVIERAASNPNVDIDKMERLLLMQERILEREAKAAYAADLALMQPNLPSGTRSIRISSSSRPVMRFGKISTKPSSRLLPRSDLLFLSEPV